MARVDLWAFLHLNQKSLQDTEKQTVDRFRKMGSDMAIAQADQYEHVAEPKMRRAAKRVIDTTNAVVAKDREAIRTREARTDATRRAIASEEKYSDIQAAQSLNAQRALDIEKRITAQKEEHARANRNLIDREKELTAAQLEHATQVRKLSELQNNLTRASVNKERKVRNPFTGHEVLVKTAKLRQADERDASARQSEEITKLTKDVGTAKKELQGVNDDLARSQNDLNGSVKDATTLNRQLEGTEKDLTTAKKDHAKTTDDLNRLDEERTRVHRTQTDALLELDKTQKANDENERNRSRRGGGGRGGRGGGANTLGSIFTDIPGVPGGKAGAIIGLPIITLLADVAQGAVTASQALALLPAVAVAGGAALGTLALGMSGFDQALKDMGNPEKWAKDLQSLAPAAQQAALEIQYLVKGPLKELKQATEETLFAGVAEKVHGFVNQFLPTIQGLTTGIAGAFNQMFGNLTSQLMTPESQASIGRIVNDIVKAFQNLAPAVGPFVDALTRLTQVGSSFLPGLATSLSNVATTFDKWITKLQNSGELHTFIQRGIDAAGSLISIIGDLGRKVFEVFGNKTPAEFKASLDAAANTITVIAQALVTVAHIVDDVVKILNPIADMLGGWEHLIILAGAAFATWKLAGLFTTLGTLETMLSTGLAGAATTGAAGVTAALASITIPAAIAAVLGVGTGFAVFNKMQEASRNAEVKIAADNAAMHAANPSIGLNPTSIITGQGSIPGGPGSIFLGGNAATTPQDMPGLPTAGFDPFTGKPVPVPTPKDPDGTKITNKEKIDRAYAALDPSAYAVDPYAPLGASGAPTGAPPLGVSGGPGGGPFPQASGARGPGIVDQLKVDEKNQQLQKDAWDIQDAGMELEALKKSGVASQKEIIAAEHKVIEKKWALSNDQRDLLKLQAGDVSKKKAADLSAGLDADLGLGKGLAGFADNMVRFAGHMLMAPVEAALQNIIDNDPIKGGSGLFGILGAKNMAAGLSPILGRPLSDGSQGSFGQAAFGTPGASTTLGATGAPGSALPGESARDFAHRVEMPFWQSQGYQVGDHAADQNNEHQNGALDIMVPSIAEGSKVLQQVLSDPNVYGAIFNNQTYGYGHGTTPQPYGSTGSPTDKHEDHVHAFYQPGRSGDITPLPGGVGAPAGMPGGSPSFGGPASGVVPVFVTNMGGGGIGGPGGAPFGTPASGQGSGPPPGPGGPGGGGRDALASSIIAQAAAAGLNPQQTMAALAVANQESHMGADPAAYHAQNQNGTAGITGPFQQDASYAKYGDRNDPATAAKGFIDQYINTGQGLNNPNPWAQALAVQRPASAANGGYDASTLQAGQGTAAADYYNRLAPGILGGGTVPGGGTAGPMPASPFNPFGTPGLPDVSGNAWMNNRAGIPLGAPIAQGPGQYGSMQIPPGPLGTPLGGPGGPPLGTPGAPGGLGSQGPVAPPGGPGAAPAPPTGRSQGDGGWQPSGGGGLGIGGLAGGAIGAAAGAVPGMGQLAQMAMQGINRTIQYGGQLASIGVQGLFETFGLNDSALGDPSKSWAGRLAAGFAGAKPAVPNTAGQKETPVAPQQPPGAPGQQGPQGGGGPMIHIENFNNQAGRDGQKTVNDLGSASQNSKLRKGG